MVFALTLLGTAVFAGGLVYITAVMIDAVRYTRTLRTMHTHAGTPRPAALKGPLWHSPGTKIGSVSSPHSTSSAWRS